MVLPAFAVIAELAISEANRMIKVPLTEGLIMPFMVQMLPVVKALVAFDVVGRS